MSNRNRIIKVSLSDAEVAVLDERRGPVRRAAYLRQLLHERPKQLDVATRLEALHLLSQSAREGAGTGTGGACS
jgi:hypothetical protein